MLYSHLSVDHVLKLAIEEKQIPVIIAGGPKTGKTTVLSKRICHLIKHHKVPPSQITVCTLTNSDVSIFAFENLFQKAQKIKDAIKQFAGDEILKELNIGIYYILIIDCKRHFSQFMLSYTEKTCCSHWPSK